VSRSAPNLATVLEYRAALLARLRAFFAERGVLEVDTPALSPAAASDPNIESVAAEVAALAPPRQYLHTSPELAMKRLIAALPRDIYQICRVFRDRELGRWHEPEFLMLEWYRLGFDEHALMDEMHELLARALATAGSARAAPPCRRLAYAQAFDETLGVDPLRRDPETRRHLERALGERGVDVPAELDHDGLLDLALGAVIVPAFDPAVATFVHGYPASQAALAELDAADPRVAARFELFFGGLELANGFRELADAAEQRRRFAADLERRRRTGMTTAPLDEAFLAALEGGLPRCAGVALGIDRLVAIGLGAARLAEAVPLPHARSRRAGVSRSP
jgi:lysyl-tRNA synthetase class 2